MSERLIIPCFTNPGLECKKSDCKFFPFAERSMYSGAMKSGITPLELSQDYRDEFAEFSGSEKKALMEDRVDELVSNGVNPNDCTNFRNRVVNLGL